ncbi:MAG TPA: hypothetical protein VGE08_14930 [Steroidobacter sp.]|uniref:hypothetical protein n=1 Tax=Steroidobacter sp. TaxID=1978227 RepID=UPI002EDAED9D
MNHPLAVYTVIYVAILFVTVSIWGGKIGEATGDYRVLLLALGIFALKLAIDDYLHFQNVKKKSGESQLHFDLNLSLLVYLLLAVSIAMAATERGEAAAISFALVFATGMLWLCMSGFEGEEKGRRIGWLIVNGVSMGILLAVAFGWPPQSDAYSVSSRWLAALVGVFVADFFYFGTLRRLAELHGREDQAPPATIGRTPATTTGVPPVEPAVAVPAKAGVKEASAPPPPKKAEAADPPAATPAPASSAPLAAVPQK